MSELLTLLEENRLETILVAIFILFIMKLLDFVVKLLYSILVDRVNPVYKEVKIERIKKYLLQLLDLTMEQMISANMSFIRAYVIRKNCDKYALIAAANRPMYSEPRIFIDDIECLIETGDVSITMKRYGTEYALARKVTFKATYYIVLEASTKVEMDEYIRSQLLIVEFMLKLLDDFVSLWGDGCDDFEKGITKAVPGNVSSQSKTR